MPWMSLNFGDPSLMAYGPVRHQTWGACYSGILLACRPLTSISICLSWSLGLLCYSYVIFLFTIHLEGEDIYN